MPRPYEMWAWLVEEEDGTEGVLAVAVTEEMPWFGTFALGSVMLLQSRKREYADVMETFAREHERNSGRPVRLAHLVEVRE